MKHDKYSYTAAGAVAGLVVGLVIQVLVLLYGDSGIVAVLVGPSEGWTLRSGAYPVGPAFLVSLVLGIVVGLLCWHVQGARKRGRR